MEAFPDYEVKSGESFHVKVPEDKVVLLTKAYLKEDTERVDKNKTIYLRLRVDGRRLVAGSLHPQRRREQVLRLTIDKDFQISHSLSNGSVHFSAAIADKTCGYRYSKSDTDSTDFDDEEE
ncbi:histone deacetylase HDT1 [Lactuca sativa]|uniref:histone deacetylase HDT1 n=1 Tax=Lactuca sativa TaxID=4236 RepID=UPI000CD9CCE9|nr:histone deacetylase HDT1 [Lactuca sativa]XP_023733449.1 histone deacetylase HDT1 [Lactuca sativa]